MSESDTQCLPLEIDGGQLSFFSDQEESRIKGLSTGEGLFKRDPRLYQLTVKLLGQDAPIREIMRITGLHNRTIQAVREREGETIDTLRKSLGARALRTATLAIESLEEKILEGFVKPGELAMAAGILIDKGQVLTGGVTARMETLAGEKVEDRLKDLLASIPVADAETVKDCGTGIGGGNCSPIDSGSGSDLELEGQTEMGDKDLQSSVSPTENAHVATFVATDLPEKAPLVPDADLVASEIPPGGRGCDDRPPDDRGIGKEPEKFICNGTDSHGDASAEPSAQLDQDHE
jgi:hypothetical protein